VSEERQAGEIDLGDFCRRVEEHLTRVNQGQIIRVVGPAFELVRGWALEGMPLSIVMHGIDLKAERHRAGRSTRPLRLEFCEHDVRDVYVRWRRSVGLANVRGDSAGEAEAPEPEKEKRPSLSRQLDRALDKLARVAGRLDLAEAFRVEVSRAIEQLSTMREAARGARGDAKQALVERLPAMDAALMAAARAAIDAAVLERLTAEASEDLAAYRGRLPQEVWRRSVDRALDRLVRDHLGLPTLALDV
jgi:hypothetical protein